MNEYKLDGWELLLEGKYLAQKLKGFHEKYRAQMGAVMGTDLDRVLIEFEWLSRCRIQGNDVYLSRGVLEGTCTAADTEDM